MTSTRAVLIGVLAAIAATLGSADALAQQDRPTRTDDCLRQLDEYVARLGITPDANALRAARAQCLRGDTSGAFEVIDFNDKQQTCTIEVNNYIKSRPELLAVARETQEAAVGDCMRGDMNGAHGRLLGAAKPRIEALSVSAERIAAGGSASVTWNVVNADMVLFGEPDPVDSRSLLRARPVNASDTLVLSPTSTTTYILHAENKAQDTARQQFTVDVLPPIVLKFNVQPAQVCPQRRDRITLEWDTQNADEVTLNDQQTQPSGHRTEQPRGAANTMLTYHFVARNTFESVETTRQVRIIACQVNVRDHRTNPDSKVRDHRTNPDVDDKSD